MLRSPRVNYSIFKPTVPWSYYALTTILAKMLCSHNNFSEDISFTLMVYIYRFTNMTEYEFQMNISINKEQTEDIWNFYHSISDTPVL